jgi:HEAT repeat protein
MYGSDVGLTRAKAVAVLVRLSAKSNLDSGTSQLTRQIVRRALHDPSDAVRSDAVHALGHFGKEDIIPALREVEESDPSPEVQGLSIRTEATKAIEAIHKRTNGN